MCKAVSRESYPFLRGSYPLLRAVLREAYHVAGVVKGVLYLLRLVQGSSHPLLKAFSRDSYPFLKAI